MVRKRRNPNLSVPPAYVKPQDDEFISLLAKEKVISFERVDDEKVLYHPGPNLTPFWHEFRQCEKKVQRIFGKQDLKFLVNISRALD